VAIDIFTMRYQFGEFTLDTERFELSKAGQPIRAEPQVVELLGLLVAQGHRMCCMEGTTYPE
jgi:DNA-binding winged helix-turn-helix (wHTH) protein